MKLSIVAPINDLSYGIVATNIISELIIAHHNIYLFPINHNPNTSPKLAPFINKALHNAENLDFNAPCIRIWHQNNMGLFAGRGRRIGFPIFELDRFNDIERHHLKNCDRLFVCSEWAKRVVENNGIKVPCQIVHLGVDRDIFEVDIKSCQTTRFLNIGKLEIRKGHDFIPSLFKKAFPNDEDVELWMVNYNLHYSQEENEKWFRLYKNTLGDKVKIFPRLDSQIQIANVMNQVDCGIFPSRAEGWNLEVLEMMSCGKKSIVLNYSALTEYCTKDNSYLVEVDEFEDAQDGVWFHGQGRWAKVGSKQEESIIEYMRQVYKDKQNGKINIFSDCVNTAKQFSWKNSSNQIITNLE